MGAHTDERPKCLATLADGETLLGRQLSQLAARGVERVVLVGGYRLDALEAFLSGGDHDGVELRCNAEWACTGSVTSLLRAEDELLATDAGPLLITHGDIVYEPALLDALLSAQRTATVLDTTWRAETGDEVIGRYSHEGLLGLAKRAPAEQGLHGEFVGLSVFAPDTARAFAARCEAAAPTDDYELPVLDAFVSEGHGSVAVVPVADLAWRNVNDEQDLLAARRQVAGSRG
jgi:choline kinase